MNLDDVRLHPIKLILLPGMDGTGELYVDFARSLPAWIDPEIVSYPRDQKLTYDQLCERIESVLPRSEPFVVLGESFSSPLAVMIAAKAPANLRAAVLCAGFVTSPTGGITGQFADLFSPIAFSCRAPRFAIRRYLVGDSASGELVRNVSSVIAKVPGGVLAHRLHSVLACDCRSELSSVTVPVLYVEAERDQLVSKRSVEIIRQARPETTFVSVDGPHLVVQARPREVATEVIGFLRRHT